ncbi:N-acetylglucosaminidase [Bacillus inaquosorum]|uniref:Beta-N-acetylglucosaminidase n=1 Tax=Bacillus inaquosorum KCTC 13429 TaxID=1236548 RepID=A0A9W5PEM2_9BACI|nr:N-acetylglucosaminidase [Bacillus inaquosorum]ELS62840.1 hypothetical protein BSI_02310 [Bacillus inaquosorum KCTC 13429]MCY7906986.1 N-acetylglucosaminidase [Bacillus inaquosorum]MCY7930800.1 N-acetylglucosaminidase [Bacillus inaquosorum]MCY8769904.1 N-acetylglucosaminidase [Bacillus inaquosorum]MCY9050435.1 N-acetylglucosaminidase [Bacillus inaquosorum]
MRKYLYLFSFVILFFLILSFNMERVLAYTDTSTYKVTIKDEFTSEDKVKEISNNIKNETGWDANYKLTGQSAKAYKIITGGFYGESKVKEVLNDFEQNTRINGSYSENGNVQTIYQVTTGGFIGESKVKQVLEMLQAQTGVKGTYTSTGEKQYYYRIVSGGFQGEQRMKEVLSKFQNETSIKGSYEPIGDSKITYTILSGGFSTEDIVKKAAEETKSQTGIDISYEKIPDSSSYRLVISNITENELSDIESFFGKKNWWYAKKEINNQSYRLISAPILDDQIINKGLSFFESNKWWATKQKTDVQGENKFRITTEKISDQTKLQKALSFFEANKWWADAQKTTIKGYKITSDVIDTEADLNKGLEYFKSRNLWATYSNLSKDTYMLNLNEEFTGIENVTSAVNKLTNTYGLNAEVVKIKDGPQIMYTNYNLTLSDMISKQMNANPQTDSAAYVSLSYINTSTSTVTADYLNIRSSPEVKSDNIIGQVQKGDKVSIISKEGNWAKINLGWRKASREEVAYYINPENFSINSKYYFQFLKLSQYAGISASEVNNKILKGKGILEGKGESFIKAAEANNINELYLISHALLETGNGSSELANGVMYNGKKVYNMYGIGAYDGDAVTKGAQYAYNQGWFTPEAAILGGAKFIGSSYIHNSTYHQDTLYKMRWEPTVSHQYATDIGWAYKQVNRMYSLYTLLDNYTLYYDIPKYK